MQTSHLPTAHRISWSDGLKICLKSGSLIGRVNVEDVGEALKNERLQFVTSLRVIS